MLPVENTVLVLLDRNANFNMSFRDMNSATKSMTLCNRCSVEDSGSVVRLSEGERVRERERLKGESSRPASHLRVAAALSRLACRRVNPACSNLASPPMEVGGTWRRVLLPSVLMVVQGSMKCVVDRVEEPRRPRPRMCNLQCGRSCKK
jgi:hypothetical protein